jgi:hypothetical protein
MEAPAARSPNRHGVAWRRIAAILVLVPSLENVLYAGMLPGPLGFEHKAVVAGFGFDWILTPLGIAGIVAAIGVWRGRSWARVLAGVVTVVMLALMMWLPLPMGLAPTSIADVIGLWDIPLGLAGITLFALVRRWEPAARPVSLSRRRRAGPGRSPRS